jgi:hypothetical protein
MLENATPHLLDIYFINFPLILRFTLTLKLTTKIVKVVLNTKITPTQKKQSRSWECYANQECYANRCIFSQVIRSIQRLVHSDMVRVDVADHTKEQGMIS